ncbi:MAG: uridine kinase [Bryobacterales bacterium]|nr:uridine kinase [Bryobacterales bacterium]
MVFSVAVSRECRIDSPTAEGASPRADSGVAPTRIIAIAGASGSGKTYLSNYAAGRLDAPILSLDSYYLDLSHLPSEERAQWNFDDPASLDWALLRAQLSLLRAGRWVNAPVYDFSTHTRTQEARRVEAREYLVLEGIFALYDAEVRAMLSVGVFIDYPDAGCLERRTARDVAERGRTAVSVRQQYARTVRPMFAEHIAPTRRYAQIVVQGDSPPEQSFETLEACLRS